MYCSHGSGSPSGGGGGFLPQEQVIWGSGCVCMCSGGGLGGVYRSKQEQQRSVGRIESINRASRAQMKQRTWHVETVCACGRVDRDPKRSYHNETKWTEGPRPMLAAAGGIVLETAGVFRNSIRVDATDVPPPIPRCRFEATCARAPARASRTDRPKGIGPHALASGTYLIPNPCPRAAPCRVADQPPRRSSVTLARSTINAPSPGSDATRLKGLASPAPRSAFDRRSTFNRGPRSIDR